MKGMRPCDNCSRHVRIGDSVCPFCGTAFAGGAPLPPKRRSGRIARAAVMVAAVITPVGCSVTPDAGLDSPDQGMPDRGFVFTDAYGAPPDTGMILSDAYGAPPEEDAGFIVGDAYGAPPEEDAGFIVGDAYGAPDAGVPDDAGDAEDAG